MLRSRTRETFRKGNSNSIGGQSMPVDAAPSRSCSSSSRMGKNNMDAGNSRTSGPVGQASSKKRRASQVKQQQQHEREGTGDARHDAEDATAVGGSLGGASRPKERRRRGKDPTKELVKSGKLNATKTSNTTSNPKSPSPSSSRGQDTTTPRLQRRSMTRSRSPSRTLGDPMSALLQRSSRSRSRSRLGGAFSGHEEDPVFSFDTLITTANRDGTASTSSASSTAATEATTFSTTSTAPLSTGDHLDRPRSDSDGTPKPESIPRRASSTRGSAKNDDDDPSWDWDGAGGGQFNNNTSPASKSTSTDVPTRFQPSRGTPGTGYLEGIFIRGSVSQPSVAGSSTFASAEGKTSSSSLSASALSSSSVQGIPKSTTSPRTDEREDEVSFPTLNNPRPSAGSSMPLASSSSSLISLAPAPGRNSVSRQCQDPNSEPPRPRQHPHRRANQRTRVRFLG
ncbi:hypothetical protein BKA70DRAFT_541245 [Coprinopsis sp. MPI-PUGE-AT-0042]|nr:hypothetical protein BKA70DRAFT_541245 [Coprinopsis sp. MPI-PUGE-AT-0042]